MREVQTHNQITDGSFLLKEYHPLKEYDTQKFWLLDDVETENDVQLFLLVRTSKWLRELEKGDAKVMLIFQYLSPLDWKRVGEIKLTK
jgi:hypothetical protein